MPRATTDEGEGGYWGGVSKATSRARIGGSEVFSPRDHPPSLPNDNGEGCVSSPQEERQSALARDRVIGARGCAIENEGGTTHQGAGEVALSAGRADLLRR